MTYPERCSVCGAALDRRGTIARIVLAPLVRDLRRALDALERMLEGL